MGYHLRWPKKNLTHCPGWVDHYNMRLNGIGYLIFQAEIELQVWMC